MAGLWELIRRQAIDVLKKPATFLVSGGLALILAFGAAPAASSEQTVAFDLSGRLFLLVCGLAAILGYAFAVPLRRGAEQTSDEIVSFRKLNLAKIVSSTAFGTIITWIGGLCAILITSLRFGRVVLPVGDMGVFLGIGVPLIAAAFAGAITLASLVPSRSVRTAVRWGLFLPGMIVIVMFRLDGSQPMVTPRILFLAILSALLLCIVEAYLLFRLVPDRQTLRPR